MVKILGSLRPEEAFQIKYTFVCLALWHFPVLFVLKLEVQQEGFAASLCAKHPPLAKHGIAMASVTGI